MLKDLPRQPPNDPGAAYQVGSALLRIRQDRLGLYWLDQALQRNPRYQPAHKALAEYYESKGEPEKAAPHRARVTQPDRKAASR